MPSPKTSDASAWMQRGSSVSVRLTMPFRPQTGQREISPSSGSTNPIAMIVKSSMVIIGSPCSLSRGSTLASLGATFDAAFPAAVYASSGRQLWRIRM
jgi:hypothetical protein